MVWGMTCSMVSLERVHALAMAETLLQAFKDHTGLGAFPAIEFKAGETFANGGIIRPTANEPVRLQIRARITADHGNGSTNHLP
jgi:hypothetical protein